VRAACTWSTSTAPLPASRKTKRRSSDPQEVGDEIPVQLGGGIRDLDTIERCLDDGLSYVIIGTAAVKNPGFLHDACGAFPGHIIVGLDARDGKVAVDGWSKMTGHDVIDLAKKFEDYGVEA
jgi:phosphoribosylformimino-5-aminoimidazole carboxamide ribotide isomerase